MSPQGEFDPPKMMDAAWAAFEKEKAENARLKQQVEELQNQIKYEQDNRAEETRKKRATHDAMEVIKSARDRAESMLTTAAAQRDRLQARLERVKELSKKWRAVGLLSGASGIKQTPKLIMTCCADELDSALSESGEK
jgi:cell division septum initiation protein DivIVA